MGGGWAKTTGLTDQDKVLGNLSFKKTEGERRGEGYYNKTKGGRIQRKKRDRKRVEKTRMRGKTERERIQTNNAASCLYCAIFTFRGKDEKGTPTWRGRSQIL